jgi:hypothetical protein
MGNNWNPKIDDIVRINARKETEREKKTKTSARLRTYDGLEKEGSKPSGVCFIPHAYQRRSSKGQEKASKQARVGTGPVPEPPSGLQPSVARYAGSTESWPNVAPLGEDRHQASRVENRSTT